MKSPMGSKKELASKKQNAFHRQGDASMEHSDRLKIPAPNIYESSRALDHETYSWLDLPSHRL